MKKPMINTRYVNYLLGSLLILALTGCVLSNSPTATSDYRPLTPQEIQHVAGENGWELIATATIPPDTTVLLYRTAGEVGLYSGGVRKDRTISSIRSSSPLGPGPLQVLGTNGFITGIAIIDGRIAAQASSVKLIYTDG